MERVHHPLLKLFFLVAPHLLMELVVLSFLFGASLYHSGTSWALGIAFFRNSRTSFSSCSSCSFLLTSISLSCSRSFSFIISSNFCRSFTRSSVSHRIDRGTVGRMFSLRRASSALCAACRALKSGMDDRYFLSLCDWAFKFDSALSFPPPRRASRASVCD